jgi:hypothetical protein
MKVILQNVRQSFFDGFEATSYNGSAPTYSSTVLFAQDHPAFELVKNAIDTVGAEKFKDKWPTIKKELESRDKTCLHNGDNKASLAGYAGNWYLTARNKIRPRIVDRDNSELTQADGRPYSGCFVNMSIEIWAQENQHGKRINASLRGVQFLADGEPFAGGAAANEDEFSPVDELAVMGL